MKIRIFCVILLLCTLGFSSVFPAYAAPKKSEAPVQQMSEDALASRFLNMLNHNRVYDDAFLDVDSMVNESVIGLLDLRDEADPDYIAEHYVKDFMLSMYGIEIVDMSALNADMPKKDGFVYIIPRGYEEFTHKNAQVRLNEDGTYTVNTDITISLHDGEEMVCRAVSLFVKNSASTFGYNIISSDIIEDVNEV